MSQYAAASEFAVWGLPPGATSGVSASIIDAHLEGASALADSYIGMRGYDIPLTTWGLDVTQAVCRIAAWTLLSNFRGLNPDGNAHEALQKAHDTSVLWLRDVAKGVANLSVVDISPKRRKVALAESICADSSDESRGW